MSWRRSLIALVALAAGFTVLYAEVLRKLAAQWLADDNYSHGFLVVPLALYFVWERRSQLGRAPLRPSPLGLLAIGASLALLAAGVLGSEFFLTRISMIGVLAGAVLYVAGREHLRILAFPLAFLLLMIPLPAIAFDRIAFPLQLVASHAGETALYTAGVPVLREGNVLHLATTSLEVVDACSGIRSIVSLVMMAVVIAYFSPLGPAARALLVASAVPIAIVANAARVAGSGFAAHQWGAAAADGFLHAFSGGLVFFTALGLLLGLQHGLTRLPAAGRRGHRAVGRSREDGACSGEP